MPRALSLMQAGLLVCNLAMSPALAQVAGEDLDGPPPATATQPQSTAPLQPGAKPQPSAPMPPGAQPHAQVRRFIERFHAANTAGDGRLTLAQAQAGHMPMIARNFDAIDTQHRGYVTLQDIRAYRQQMRAMRESQDGTSN
jgi:hypothetical protein